MKDIKVKVYDKNPKIRNPASRLPKELVRSAVLEAKEKSRDLPDRAREDTGQESPTEYAANKMESAEQRIGSESASAAYRAGKKMAVKTREKISERKQTQRAAQEAKEAATEGVHGSARQLSSFASRVEKLKGNRRDSRMQSRIKLKPESKDLVREAQKKMVRTAPRVVKVSPRASGKVKTQNAIQKRQAVKSAKAAKQAAVKSAQAARQSAKAAKTTAKGLKAIAEAAATTVKAIFAAVMAGGGAVLVLLIVIVGIIGGAAFMGSTQSAEPLSAEVLAHTPTIQRYTSEFGIPEYVPVIQAIMMQESGGRGTDPMQSSECLYNTQYPNSPGAIQDPDYSIKVGIQYYADCIREAGCTSPQDMDKLKLSLQGYNYGNGYITWAIRNHGGYSEANALQFSQEQAAAHGWSRYGDPEYVPHVLRYYSGGGLFAGLFGNGQIVSIAKAQLGNEGGQKFWSWYGFNGRVEWCACFVSWCADQSGLIQSGAVPKFSACTNGVTWFQGQGKWQAAGSIPTTGSIIFFDWDGDGTSDHVGIVDRCDGSTVYTVEGNSGDAVKQNTYAINSSSIMGYGLVAY
ncbi:lysozyme family protein [Blautia sp.]|uniref:lysozyme family protein n=1 Tax=Blautia sp. TaxID=1955243 RepID=UPI00258CDF1B|nr:lysozyme family protein [Blautia sp.]